MATLERNILRYMKSRRLEITAHMTSKVSAIQRNQEMGRLYMLTELILLYEKEK